MSRLQNYNDPKIIGPGTWLWSHKLIYKALVSKSASDFDYAYKFIEILRSEFPCKKCRKHLNDECAKKDPYIFYETKDAKGLADWWYGIHAIANKHAGNYEESLEEVEKFFLEQNDCEEIKCSAEEETEISTRPPPPGIDEDDDVLISMKNTKINIPSLRF